MEPLKRPKTAEALAWVLGAWFVNGCTTGGEVLTRGDNPDVTGSASSVGETKEPPNSGGSGSFASGDAASPSTNTEDPPVLNNVTRAAAGNDQSCVIQARVLYCAGANDLGQLGVGDTVARSTATRTLVEGPVEQMVAGYGFTCIRDSDGGVACFGTNALGQIGNGSDAQSVQPTAAKLTEPAEYIAAKFGTVCAVVAGGGLRCWGANDNNQCGTGTYVAGDKVTEPVVPNFSKSARSVSVGRGHTCVITVDDELWCWGSNGSLELGLGPDAPGLTIEPQRVSELYFAAVAAGQNHTCAITTDRALYCWGNNLDADGHPGPMGHDDPVAHDVPARVGEDSDWQHIATDTFHSCGIRGEGELWCWGRNAEGQLGVGSQDVVSTRVRVDPEFRYVDVAVGRFHTCAVRGDGAVLCVGANENGQLATGDGERRSWLTLIQ